MELILKRSLVESPVVPYKGNVDEYFKPAIPVNSYQTALQICLEALGAISPEVTVVLPVTSSAETVSAVLRAGGYPCLLDIDPTTLQLDPESLDQVLKASKEAVVVLNFPGGWDIDTRIKEVCDRYNTPTIVDSRLPVSKNNYGPKGTFTVYDYAPFMGQGSLIWPGHDSYYASTMLIRSGVLGHGAHMSAPQANTALSLEYHSYFEKHSQLVLDYKEALDRKKVKYKFNHFDRYPIIEHESADAVIAKLDTLGFEAVKACTPLYTFESLRERWQEDPSELYPVAKKMHNRIVALPTTARDKLSLYQIAQAISEVL